MTAPGPLAAMETSLYIHFPFCLKKCLYCDFNSFAGSPVTPEEYTALVLAEMDLRRPHLPGPVTAASLYFGGGTPSLLEPGQVARLVEAAVRLYGLSGEAEVTIEANPGTVTGAALAGYRRAGVNRLSLGVQSFSDQMLDLLGRVHTVRQALDSFAAARAAGFANVSIDLMHSLPGQTPDAWLSELARAVLLKPEHISAYALSVEAGTPFALLADQGRLVLPPEEDQVTMFRETSQVLREGGYEHYEISSFALAGFRSRHNGVYWQRGNYLGFGAGAHSFLRTPDFGRRWRNKPAPEEYGKLLAGRILPEEEISILTRREAMSEFLFLGLRMRDGIELARFREEFGSPVEETYPGELDELAGGELVEVRDGMLRITEKGLLLANQVLMRFV